MIMEVLKRIADKHDLVCLLHEKPFNGINGSGKHNNWSLCTDTGENLLSMGKTPEENLRFLLIVTAVIVAVDEYADLLRATTATASNDRRLCGFEAPPTIVSIFIGDELYKIFNTLIEEKGKSNKTIKLGETLLKPIKKFSADRNRTSPFAFVDNRFEFRMPGSSTSIAVCNTILNAAVAEKLSEISSRLENSSKLYEDAQELVVELIERHKRIIYHGNGYSKEWEDEAKERGLNNVQSSPEALKAFTTKKSIELFEKYNIYTEKETISRYVIKMDKYSHWIDIEAHTMNLIARSEILPACLRYSEMLSKDIKALDGLHMITDIEKELLQELRNYTSKLHNNIKDLDEKLEKARVIKDFEEKAIYYKNEIIEGMNSLRNNVDNLELIIPKDMWPMPTYSDIFLED